MAIVYCSWATGNDTTGDGTAANPFKTITKASTSRSPGDEVRVAKSAEPTVLTGTVGFTLNSTTVTGVGTAFTSELAIGDFIQAPDGQYYEVITLTSDTAAVLYKRYPGETQSGYASYKLGVTDTGAASSSTGTVQSINSSGNSSNSIYVSGGWDLSTETQTGQTWFRQIQGTFANRYGIGLNVGSKAYLNFDKINFLRYYYGFYTSGAIRINIINITCNSNSTGGIFISGGNYNNIQNAICNSNGGSGLIFNSSNSEHTNLVCNSNGNGISTQGDYNVFVTVTCNSNYSNGFYHDTSSDNNVIQSATFLYNSDAGIRYYYSCSYNILQSATCNFNKYGIFYYIGARDNTIINAICNSNTLYGIHYNDSCYSNVIINATCNLNETGVYFHKNCCNNIIHNITCNSNPWTISYSGTEPYCSNNVIYKLSASDNITLIRAFGFNNVFHNVALIGDMSFVTPTVLYPETMVYINNLNGYSYILSDYAMANSQDATAGGTGKEWKFAITNAARNTACPFYIPIARVAVASSGKVTVKVYFKKSGTGIAGALRCRYGQVEWSDASEDIIVNCPDDTARNQVTLQFTPTEAGVVEIEAGAWYVSAVDQNIIIDDITITQA